MKCGKEDKIYKQMPNLQSGNVLRCKADIKQDEIFNEVQMQKRQKFKEKPIHEKKLITGGGGKNRQNAQNKEAVIS